MGNVQHHYSSSSHHHSDDNKDENKKNNDVDHCFNLFGGLIAANQAAPHDHHGNALTIIEKESQISPPKLLRPPKHILWGCKTPEEHYARIEEVLNFNKQQQEQVVPVDNDQQGTTVTRTPTTTRRKERTKANNDAQQQLRALGFEFQMVHHPEKCMCNFFMDDDYNGNGNYLEDGDDDDNDQDYFEPSGVYMVPIAMDGNDDDNDDDGDEENNSNEKQHDNEPYYGIESSTTMDMSLSPRRRDNEDDQENNKSPTAFGGGGAEAGAGAGGMSRSTSAVSLFSLGTHYSRTDSNVSFPQTFFENEEGDREEEGCALRLHHIPSDNTLITTENHEDFIAHGKMYDRIAELCMEYAQNIMMQQGNLRRVSVSETHDIHAFVSRDRVPNEKRTCTTDNIDNRATDKQETQEQQERAEEKQRKRVLLVVTGKGLVRAGIFSRRHLMTHGVETATAIPFVAEAARRNMDVIMLDPNAKGSILGMDVVEASLERLFFEQNGGDIENDGEEEGEEIFVLAHSMAGAQIVRLLHKKRLASPLLSTSSETSSETEAGGGGSSDDNNNNDNGNDSNNTDTDIATKSTESLQRKIKAIAFTDSNHNINWIKDNQSLTSLLVGPASLYIKSHKHHEDAKPLGQPHHDCDFWRHRFGTIKTLWAGTHEHALTNYTARFHIWQHFDAFLDESS